MKVKNHLQGRLVMKVEELVVLSVNVRSLTAAKRDHLLRVAELCKAHALCVQETWLTQGSRVTSGFGNSWNIFRRDRNRSGGGVLIAVRDSVVVLRSRVDPSLELVGVELQLAKGRSVWIESVYVPPGQADLETGSLGVPRGHRYIFGDLNNASRGEWVDSCIQDGWVVALPSTPTHNRGGILDGALMSPQAADQGLTTAVMDDWISDHALLVHRIGIEAEVLYRKHPKSWIFAKADWEGYRSAISNDIVNNEQAQVATSAEMYSKLVSCIGKAAFEHIPRAPRTNQQPFWNEELEAMRKSAADLRREIRGQRANGGVPDEVLRTAAEASEVALRAAVRSAQRERWKSFQLEKGGNLSSGKVFWRFIRRLRSTGQTRDVRDAVRDPTGDLVSGLQADREIREYIIAQGRNVRKQLRGTPLERCTPAGPIVDTELTDDFNRGELESVLSKMRSGSAPGTDGITFKMLKELPNDGMELLLKLANKIWSEGATPGRMKEARLIRLDKPNCQDPYLISNLRFIAVESCIARVVEALIAARLGTVLERHSLLPDESHGFRARRSTISALRMLREQTKTHSKRCNCCSSEERGRLTAVLQLDFERFYDRVTNKILCRKMKALGLDGRMTAFVRDWMVGRIAWISDRTGVRMRVGIPQGSPLSCSLANIYIADLIRELKRQELGVVNYADDNNITARASRKADSLSAQAAELSLKMQSALTVANEWAKASGAKLKAEKSKLSCFLPRNNRFEGKILEQMDVPGIGKALEPTILGVVLDRYGIGGKHVKARIQLAGKRAGALKALSHVGLRVMRQLYVGGVRSCALYGIESFHDLTPTAMASLERLQNGALKYMARLRDGTPSVIVGRLLRVPPISLIIECRWKIRDGMDRTSARRWLEEEWDRRTMAENRVPMATRDDPMWELPRGHQTVILRARSGYTLLQPPENPHIPCNHPRCLDNEWIMSPKHILEECHKFTSRRRALKNSIPGRFCTQRLLWPSGDGGVDVLYKTAMFLSQLGA